jgi:ABC-type Fe3+ transport system substrate-binding protein
MRIRSEVNVKKRQRVILIILLICLLVISSGCHRKEKGEIGGTNNTMGRYVEGTLQFPREFTQTNGIVKQNDGSYLSFDGQNGLFESTDQGSSWHRKETAWLQELGTGGYYISEAVISQSGEIAIIYYFYSEDGNSDQPARCVYIAADESVREIKIELEDAFLLKLLFKEDGRLFFCDTAGRVYEIDKKNGESTELCQTDSYIEYWNFVGEKLVTISTGDRKSLIFDLNMKQIEEEDTVLDRFLQDVSKVDQGFNSDSSVVLIARGEEENSMYLACRGGLYYHVLGGNVMEQVVDGKLSTFGNPSSRLVSLTAGDDKTFLVLYSGGELIRYNYDDTVPTVPETELRIYGLEENKTIRQAIAKYQRENPEVYVNFEIGISNEDAVTTEEAVKVLNTEIIAGKGPDIILMDKLSVEYYAEKGVLLELSPVLEDRKEQLFTNISDTYKKEDKIYAVPARFSFSILAGRSSDVNQISDLATFAAAIQEIRAHEAVGNILGIYTEEELLDLLSISCGPSWIKEDGTIDQEKLKEFFFYAKQIYEAEKLGITPDMDKAYRETEESNANQTEDIQDAVINALYLSAGDQRIACGYVSGIDMDYTVISSLFHSLHETGSIQSFQLQAHNVYLPKTVVAINANTANVAKAREFIRLLLSEQIQSVDLSDGLPVNKASFEKLLADSTKNGEAAEDTGTLGMTGKNGDTILLELKKLSGKEAGQLRSLVENLGTPDLTDRILLDCVRTLGPSALNGKKNIDQVVLEIIEKQQIRLKE